jgi:hypothetical protein
MEPPYTLPFDRFWSWLLGHPNCIIRAGTPEAVLYDDEDLHWHFASEGVNTLLIQVLRGKRLLGEVLLDPEQITYVQAVPVEREQEHVFELVTETENDRFAAYFFVLAHGYDGEESFSPARVH